MRAYIMVCSSHVVTFTFPYKLILLLIKNWLINNLTHPG